MIVDYADASSMLVRLSFADRHSLLDTMTTHAGYTLPRAEGEEWDVGKLEAAVRRAADKWRLLAGRVVRDETVADSHAFAVRVPLGDLEPEHRIITLTRKTHRGPVPSALGSLSHDPARFALLAAPDQCHFVHPSTDLNLVKLVNRDAPIIALHLGTFADTLSLGLSVPHGIFDAKGLGFVLRAIEAELNGDDWTPPPLDEENRLTKAADELVQTTPHVPYGSWRRILQDVISWLWFGLAHVVRFKLWRACASKGVFIGRDLLAGMVEAAKAEVEETRTGEYVTEADVVSAWLMKAVFAGEAERGVQRKVAWAGNFCYRAPLSELTSVSMANYPHNCLKLYVLSPPPLISSLPSTPLSALALSLRHSILRARAPANLASLLEWSQTHRIQSSFHENGWGSEWMCLTNQVGARLTGVDWSAAVKGLAQKASGERGVEGPREGGFWVWQGVPWMDHVVSLNKVEGGWMVIASMARDRWASVERALQGLEKEVAKGRDGTA